VSAAWAPSREVPDADTSSAAQKETRGLSYLLHGWRTYWSQQAAQVLAYQTSLKLIMIRGMCIDDYLWNQFSKLWSVVLRNVLVRVTIVIA
jgi:hypothetical protein